MLHRRSTATAVAALVVLAGGALSSCGFDAPTDRVNTIAAGINNRDASVDALGVRVLASVEGEGRLIGALANNTSDTASLTTVSGEDVTVAEFEPIEVPASGRVNLATAETSVQLTGDFTAGEWVTIELEFDADGAETVEMRVPVVKNCHQYTAVPTPSAADSTSESDEPDESASTESEHEDATFVCEHPTGDAGH